MQEELEYLDPSSLFTMISIMAQDYRAYCRSGPCPDEKSFLKHLPKDYSMHMRYDGTLKGTMLDTFEGHLRRSGQLLLQSAAKITLTDLMSGDTLIQSGPHGWMFAEHLAAGPVADRLLGLSSLRAFSDVCSMSIEQYELTVRDELDKTVIRGRVMLLRRGKDQTTLIVPVALRGYNEELILLEHALQTLDFKLYGKSLDIYPLLNLSRKLYSSKPGIDLDGGEAIFESANRITGTFLDVARRNEEGIIADVDTEFLHDFRVSLRRIRSLLSLFRNVYGEEDCRYARMTLADIMTRTNRLRDLDVYLLDRSEFYALVPDSMHRGLDTLFDLFAEERASVFEQFSAFVQSAEYREKIDECQHRFKTPDGMSRGSAAQESTARFANRMIMKRYGKVAKLARSITSNTPDEAVHALRIQCKKLRYLMEFFVPLYASESIKPLLKSLKGLQDGLGHFNDCSVQRASLAAFVDEHPMRGRKGLLLAESVGALVATLYQMQLRARTDIDASLGRFSNRETNQRFRGLFAEGGSA